MIFASDLDQTLIYSENFIARHYRSAVKIKSEQLKIIEYYQGKPLSYIHPGVIKLLQEFNSQHHFVPVTTRTEEQYRRIQFADWNINPRYAITTNGAKVLIDGKPDLKWQHRINKLVQQSSPSIADIKVLLKDFFSKDQVLKIREAEDVFIYCVLDMSQTSLAQINDLRKCFSKDDWRLSLQGRKLYFMPHFISKGDAIKYVCECLGESRYIAAGDSLLDLPLLVNAQKAYIPGHGEIFEQGLHREYDVIICKNEGVTASVQILEGLKSMFS
ncbi:hypothetical protein EYV94_18745 [Puteibacter caeruleilacunae]|nr:hypothetical protein EYV94_18745 [Puteibacter caeruleilacunae]